MQIFSWNIEGKIEREGEQEFLSANLALRFAVMASNQYNQ